MDQADEPPAVKRLALPITVALPQNERALCGNVLYPSICDVKVLSHYAGNSTDSTLTLQIGTKQCERASLLGDITRYLRL